MQKNIKNIIILLVLISYGCTKEINIDLPEHEPVPVLNCIFFPGEVFKLELTRSGSIFAGNFEIIEDASILLFENDNLVDSLYYNEGFYYSNYLPGENNTYKVIARLHDGTILEAEDKIPLKGEVLNFTFQDSVMQDDEYYLSMAEIRILDNSSILQYFEIVMFGKSVVMHYSDQTYYDRYFRLNFSSTKNFDPVVVESGLLAYSTSSLLFSNNLFTDKENIIRALYNRGVYVDPIMGTDPIEDIVLVLRTVSEHYFFYKKQLAIYNTDTGLLFASANSALDEPVFLHSNVKGGKGIFAGFSFDSDTVSYNLNN